MFNLFFVIDCYYTNRNKLRVYIILHITVPKGRGEDTSLNPQVLVRGNGATIKDGLQCLLKNTNCSNGTRQLK